MFDPTLVKISPNIQVKLGKQKRIGILNQGKNNKFKNNTFENLDVAIQDEGENTIAEGNEVK